MTLIVNGKEYHPSADTTLLDYLRNTLMLTGTKDGCSEGSCGACTVIVDGKAVKACTRRLSKLDGASVTTIEGLSYREKEVYSYAFAAAGAVQCGFCTPGMVMAAKALIDTVNAPETTEIRKAIRGNICRCTGYVKIEEAIKLAASILQNDKEVPSLDSDPTLSGRMARIDAYEKVVGTGLYADDIRITGMAYAVVLRPPFPRIRVNSIDAAEAEKRPGVIRIIKAADVPHNRHGHITQDWPVLIPEGGITSYAGDALCIVVAETRETAEKARELIVLNYDVLPGVYSPEEALKDEIPVHEGESNLYDRELITRGNADKAIAESDIIFSETYTTPFTEHAFMEPECAVAMPDGNDGLIVYTGGQSIYDEQREISRMLCKDPGTIRVKSMLVGGGFGGKEDMSVQHHAALAAWITGRAVNLRLTRQESLIVHPKRHPMKMDITLGCTKDGKINGMKARIIADTGAYASLGGPVLQRACTHASGPYSFTDFSVEGLALYTNNVPAGAFRGFGVTQSCFAIESAMDEIALLTGNDAYTIREKNILHPGDTMPNGQIAGSDTAIEECLKAVKERYYASERTGIALAMKNSGVGVGLDDRGRCTISVEDGKIHIRSSAACMGQGVQTVELQIAAETLSMPASAFIVEAPDTSRTPDSGTSTASRQTAFTGEAVRKAAMLLKEALGKESLQELEGREFYAEFAFETDPITSTKPNPVSHLAYSFSAQVAELDEDMRIKRITAACDAGTVINMTAIEGQIEGGVLMGMGYALTEDFITQDGMVKSKYGTLGLLRSTERPEIETILVHAEGRLPSAYGAKGVGELCTIPTAPAIANAYRRLDGKRRTSLPLDSTPYSRKKPKE